ncbi:hypothetical protein NDK43_06930 [Neobacillus pocheonensis]|uniref:Uncharacterized protein n=1 Tax=Neobacillus pocheonensis TaxID=363869 RepID=A0ABT0W9Q1_9BACI|nr:hypothetical protein [Neobacillus pocheonensis]
MSWIDVFIGALKEWDETCKNKRIKIEDACFFLGTVIGQKDIKNNMNIQSLEKRLKYLVYQESFVEEFLVNSLINEMSHHLSNEICHLGEAIINNESLGKRYEEEHGEPFPLTKNMLEEIKDLSYIYKAEESIDVWNEIIQREFSLRRRRTLKKEEFLKEKENLQNFFKQIPEDDKGKSIGELFDKYRK